jgi:hypothetical protein
MKRVQDLDRDELVAEAARYGWIADRGDTDSDLRSIVIAGRDGKRWFAAAA